MKKWIFLILMVLPAWPLAAQEVDHQALTLAKQIDDLLWHQRVGDVAYIDKVYIPTVPRWKEDNPTAQGAGNPLKVWSYIFVPRDIDPGKKYPLIVLPHGGGSRRFHYVLHPYCAGTDSSGLYHRSYRIPRQYGLRSCHVRKH
jgi:hypothetical protein